MMIITTIMFRMIEYKPPSFVAIVGKMKCERLPIVWNNMTASMLLPVLLYIHVISIDSSIVPSIKPRIGTFCIFLVLS